MIERLASTLHIPPVHLAVVYLTMDSNWTCSASFWMNDSPKDMPSFLIMKQHTRQHSQTDPRQETNNHLCLSDDKKTTLDIYTLSHKSFHESFLTVSQTTLLPTKSSRYWNWTAIACAVLADGYCSSWSLWFAAVYSWPPPGKLAIQYVQQIHKREAADGHGSASSFV